MLTVGLATFRRRSVMGTLRSIGHQETVRPEKIVVIDNDDGPSAAPLIDKVRSEVDIPITYRHVPGRNMAAARNAILDEAPTGLLALLDDDETAAPDWLFQLTCAHQPGIAAVFGRMEAVYPDHAPDWMKALTPHSQTPGPSWGQLMSGYTSNCLIDRDDPVMTDLRFDPALGQRQSEDTAFFHEGYRLGARYALAPRAIVFEPVAEDRLSSDWLMKRRYRHGRALGRRLAAESRVRTLPPALAKAAVLGLAAALTTPLPRQHWRHALRASLHAGVARGALDPTP